VAHTLELVCGMNGGVHGQGQRRVRRRQYRRGVRQGDAVFLSVEGVRLSQKGYADGIHEEGFVPLKELMDNFAKAGGTAGFTRRSTMAGACSRSSTARASD